MTCQELVELVTDYLEGALPGGERERFEAHLAVCPGCQTYLTQVQSTIALARASGHEVEPSAWSPLLVAFGGWPRRRACRYPRGVCIVSRRHEEHLLQRVGGRHRRGRLRAMHHRRLTLG